MSKVKNKAKKKRLSERSVKTSAQKKKTLNPFEVHINRQKYDVLGRKTKNGTGLPGVARAKAIAKVNKSMPILSFSVLLNVAIEDSIIARNSKLVE
jgi:nucleolar protein 14